MWRRRPRRVLPGAGGACCAGGCWWAEQRPPSTRAFCARRSRARRSSGRHPLVLCTVEPARGRASASAGAGSATLLGGAGHRGRRGPPRAAGRGDVRAGVLRAVRAPCAMRRRSGTRSRCSAREAPLAAGEGPPPRGDRPLLAGHPHGRASIFPDADGRPLTSEVGRPAHTGALALHDRRDLGGRGRTCRPQATESELGALLLEDRLIKALRPPGNVRGKAQTDGYVYLRCRLDIPFPNLEVARGRPPVTRSASARCAAARPRPSWSSSSTRCSGRVIADGSCRPRAPLGLRADRPLPVAVPA